MFDLDMDYDDDEVLLDWEQYSGTGNALSHHYVLGDRAKTASLWGMLLQHWRGRCVLYGRAQEASELA